MKKRLFPLILALVLCLSPAVRAHQIPDLTKNGTITFEVRYQGQNVDGGAMALYRVGDIAEADGNYSFALIPELAGSGLNLDLLDDPDLARELAREARSAGLTPLRAPVEDGIASFRDVASGLYVAVQPEAAEGFAAMDPFLISMPRFEDGVYLTDVTARPKVPLQTEPTEPTRPTEPTSPTGPSGPTSPTEPTGPGIPQTGQLNWPVPLMAAMGLGFFAMGWVLCFGPGKKRTES